MAQQFKIVEVYPEEFNYTAVDKDGLRYGFNTKPIADCDQWREFPYQGGKVYIDRVDYTGDWKQSLVSFCTEEER